MPLYLIVSAFVLNLISSILLQFIHLQVLSAAMLMFIVYLMLTTKYRVLDSVLDVRMGPFNRRIELKSISAVFLKNNPWRGRLYGLGSDLVGIDHEGGSVRITPKDVDGFLAAIGARRTESGDAERPASAPGP